MSDSTTGISINLAATAHLQALIALEAQCFATDRLSKRSFRYWLTHEDAIFLVANEDGRLLGYGLVLCNRGTRLARLYSIAVSPEAQGRGIAAKLMAALEQAAQARGRLFMRLEVAESNIGAQRLYEKLGYRVFGEYVDYYENHDRAIRMQKTIWQGPTLKPSRALSWYPQSTEFTCGPAALLTAMTHDAPMMKPNQEAELDIWRTATTIFMTSGHGGTHPFGLALAASRLGYEAAVRVSQTQPLFLEGVRSAHKKDIMALVHNQLRDQAETEGVQLAYEAPDLSWLEAQMAEGWTVLILISTYQLDRRKVPHWVAITHMDDRCIYVHDPDVGADQQPVDCQHVPIAREDFDRMASFGKEKLRTAVAIRRQHTTTN
ncbi:GNAT family N-acetyltransferase/peptidase C39 family protein [Reinekea blandensis]|uniref:N-acetyltransferase domain-containing protein n=1 Tax=Reinekea blandensis MED297 TaxID=314283 RepID=A4B9R5_9GAMM|nr:peptidase C39 family protein [Reinekea blandensis]EAR11366.1 hypothetical protein MED297_20802 [Reinekea sp. MED297] [Reinekea blandensis MED297]